MPAHVVATPRNIKVQLLVDTPACDWVNDRPALGCDMGIASQVTLSDGAWFAGRRRSPARMKRLQRRITRTVKESNGRRKKRLSLAKEHQRIREGERGYLHELTRWLVNEHGSKVLR